MGMKNSVFIFAVALLALVLMSSKAQATMATEAEALTVAQNWVTLIVQKKGDWGGSEVAEVDGIQDFKRRDQQLGYFCNVNPRGFVVLSLLKELTPVKAYSATCNLDPASEQGMADLIKGCMERTLNGIENRLGPLETIQPDELTALLGSNCRRSWEQIEKGLDMNYQAGEVMLTSAWHQKPPYNDQCPDMGCSWPPCYYNTNALVGCVATAGAQIMRYWNWPPYGVGAPYNDDYDWANMPDGFTGCNWDVNQVDAVAELNHEIGVAVGMNYGCSGSGALTYDMVGVYQNQYRYATACDTVRRGGYGAQQWFDRIKNQCNQNRVIQYRIVSHSIVCDGWQEFGYPLIRQYHMNYGWTNTNYNAWYTLDSLYLGNPIHEYMVENIYPEPAMLATFGGFYALPTFPYRYFDQDATGWNADFQPGHNLQFLSGIVVKCTGVTGDYVRFPSSLAQNTRLFSRGDITRGVQLRYLGGLKLRPHGEIKFH
jgi:hypothetical protein